MLDTFAHSELAFMTISQNTKIAVGGLPERRRKGGGKEEYTMSDV